MALLRLKCDKCGRVTETKHRLRACRQIILKSVGLNQARNYYCGGKLVKVERKKATKSDLDLAEYADTQYKAAMARVKRAMTSANLWSRRRTYYLKKAEGKIRVYERKPKTKQDRHSRAIDLPDDDVAPTT